jgi:creatinine amidohydrolase/Fe(II)-dependent formamide hydrolase-like protein
VKVQFEEMFPWEFAEALAKAPICYLPLGTLEWHGEHNAVGLDTLKAQALCLRAAQLSGGIVVPPFYWSSDSREDLPEGGYLTGGIEHGERYHVPGSMFWIRPETFQNLLLDMFEAMWRRGFRAIVVISGHWSENLPVIRLSGEQFLAQHPETGWLLLTDQELATGFHYPAEHAAGGETSLLMAIRPELVDLEKTLETTGSLLPYYQGQPEHLERRRTTPYKYIGLFSGEDDDSNDPELTASRERGQELFDAISIRIADLAFELLSKTTGAPQILKSNRNEP